MTPGYLRPEKTPWKWGPSSPPGAASPETGLGLTEHKWVAAHQGFQGQVMVPPWPTEACPLLAPLPFLALPSGPHPCSLLAEPDRSPGRAEIQGPYLPGGIQHAVSHLGTAIVGAPGFQRRQALCPAPWRGWGGAHCLDWPGCQGTQGREGWLERPVKTRHLLIASFVYSPLFLH